MEWRHRIMIINQSLGSFIKDVDGLRNIVRYATAPRNARETVAEHSFFVASYVLKLYDLYDFDLQKALSLGLLHDFPEIYISDVPHPIKAQNPELNDALEAAEHKVAVDHLSETVAGWLKEFNNGSSPEGLVCGLADVLSVVSYSSYEVALGNKDYMLDVFEKVQVRWLEILKKLDPYKRKGAPSNEEIAKDIQKIIKR